MYQPPQHTPTGSRRTRSNSTTTTSTTTSTTTALPSSTGWIPHIWKKTCIIQQDFRVEEKTQMSILYSVMPDSLKNRIPPIPSLRRKVTGPREAVNTTTTSSSPGSSSPPAAKKTTPTAEKPPAGLLSSPFSSGRTTPVSDAETAVMDMSDSSSEAYTDQQTTPELDGLAFADARHLASSMSMLPPAPENDDTGINWRCGAQGFGLVISSAQESRCRRSDDYNSCFERNSYIDGVQYMLQGLPRDLDPTEAAILRRSMPPALSESLSSPNHHYPSRDNKLLSDPHGGDGAGKPMSDEHRNLVHSLLLFVLIYMKTWMLWVMPYILLLSGEVISFEREHNIAGMVLAKCMAGVSASLKAIKAMSDGPLGQYLGNALEYFAEGVSGALQEFARDWFAGKRDRDLLGGGNLRKSSKFDEVDGPPGGGCYASGPPGYGYGRQREFHGQSQQARLRTKMR